MCGDVKLGNKVRESGSWTQVKLSILKEYLDAFVVATSKKTDKRYYIDAFAGPGTHKLRRATNMFDGSPRIALKVDPPFTKCFFIELNRNIITSLEKLKKEFPDRANTIEIKLGDCNKTIDTILSQIPQWAPCFAFLDPEGTELSWNTIKKLSDHKRDYKYKIELFILFPYDMGLARLLHHDLERFKQTGYRRLLNKIYGNSSWEEIYNKRVSGLSTAEQARDEFLRLYMTQLDELGYKFVIERLISGERGHPLYFLIFATDNEVGDRIMKHTFGKDRSGQMRLFKVPYKSRREREKKS